MMEVFKRHTSNFITLLLLLWLSNDSSACFSQNKFHEITIKTGSSFYQECHCTELGYSIRDIKWLDISDKEINVLRPGTQSNVYIERRNASVNLYIQNMSRTLSGNYKCLTTYNGRQHVLNYEVKAFDPLYFVNTDENQFIIKGKNSPITCEARGETVPLIEWYKSKDDIHVTDEEKYEFTPTALWVKNVTESDADIYKCTASVMDTSEIVDKLIKVDVMIIPSITNLTASPDVSVLKGEYLSIDCLAEGSPNPDYIWYKVSDANSSQYVNVTWRQENNKIIFDNIDENDQGSYECVASNKAGENRKTIDIEVLFSPEITEFRNITLNEGSTTQISCKAKGRSPPEIDIIFNDELLEVQDVKASETESEAIFSISKLSRSNMGYYLCNATNEVGNADIGMYLDVLYKPYFSEPNELIWGWSDQTVNLSCINDSNPPANITLRYLDNEMPTPGQLEEESIITTLENSTDNFIVFAIDSDIYYGIYECLAKNDLGEARKIITLKKGSVPPAIKNATVNELRATSVFFTIEGPNNFDGPDTIGFTSQYDEAVRFNFSDIHINRTWAKDRPYRLDKLKPSTTYYIKFAAVNKVGPGQWSEILEFSTPDKSSPERPTWLDDSGPSITNPVKKPMLRWKAPEANGDPIDHYQLEYCPESSDDSKHEPLCKKIQFDPTTELELNFLDYNMTYYVKLTAHNSEGYSVPLDKYVTLEKSEMLLFVPEEEFKPLLSTGAMIGVIVVAVFFGLLLLDLLLLCCMRKGIIAKCCYGKEKRKENIATSRDKKGLLKDTGEASTDNTLKRPKNGHKEYEYDKTTGIITGKHSDV